jgi:hypothetical protein
LRIIQYDCDNSADYDATTHRRTNDSSNICGDSGGHCCANDLSDIGSINRNTERITKRDARDCCCRKCVSGDAQRQRKVERVVRVEQY